MSLADCYQYTEIHAAIRDTPEPISRSFFPMSRSTFPENDSTNR